jgi:hypothetical protein
MSQAMFHKENQFVIQSKSSSTEIQHSVIINTVAGNKLTNENKYRADSFSNGINQIVGFIQRKLSRINDEEKQEFDDLKQIK